MCSIKFNSGSCGFYCHPNASKPPTIHTPEQATAIFHTLGLSIIPLVGVVHPIAIVRPEIRPVMTIEE